MIRALNDALKKGLDRVADGTCSSCGFFDPAALEDDPDLIEKIFSSLTGSGPRFVCHAGFPQDDFGNYVPSVAQMQAAPLCAGYAAVKLELLQRGLLKNPPRAMVVAICREVLRRGQSFPCIPSRAK